MAYQLLHSSCCFLILTFCIGYGDGRWRKKDKDNLYHNIDVFNRMAEKIEQEIEAFYEDYPDEHIKGDDIEKNHKEYVKNNFAHEKSAKNLLNNEEKSIKFSYTTNITNEISDNFKSGNLAQSEPIHVSFTNNDSLESGMSNWPKFEDILLEMGKRYDWKNDRWIKVKRKLKSMKRIVHGDNNSVSFHEKHKFSYRTVKLNSKSRRNVVIAVTAVR